MDRDICYDDWLDQMWNVEFENNNEKQIEVQSLSDIELETENE